MRKEIEFLIRVALLALIWLVWWWAITATLSSLVNLSIIVGGVLLAFPLSGSGGWYWTGAKHQAGSPGQRRLCILVWGSSLASRSFESDHP